MFAYLHKEMKPLIKKKLHFPGKVGGGIEKRTRELDEWLASVVSLARHDENLAMRPILYEFLSERTADITLIQTPFASGDISIDGVKLPCHEERDGTTWYALDILSTGHEPFRMWKTYKMFRHLMQEAGFNKSGFPKKSLAKCAGEALTERRKGLDFWFTSLLEEAKNTKSVELHRVIRDFCVPRGEEESDSEGEDSQPQSPSHSSGGEISAVRLTDVGERGGGVYYKVEVIAYGEEAKTYVLWKRYRQFAKLCEMIQEAVGAAAASLSNDFPPKTLGKAGVEGRKKALDFWMAQALDLSRTPQGAAAVPLLRSFLDPSHKVESIFDSSSLVEVSSVSLPSYEDRQGTIFYHIKVELSTDESFTVAKSYSMFHELCKTCGQVVMGKAAEHGFPSKTLLKVTGKDSLDQRLRQLSSWFIAMFERSLTEDYKALRPVIREFMDSSHV
eukprot:TRINITY_DN29064_c0_g1_i1.p1 TRINITY_DN29064_c0_g1~~TRINITY_DN29064_c0_g1_i1.p1  ORF type:complete len:488 (+),score=55.63 TRINITY_DN29064_c0_g1_i1:131-1465(+)